MSQKARKKKMVTKLGPRNEQEIRGQKKENFQAQKMISKIGFKYLIYINLSMRQ